MSTISQQAEVLSVFTQIPGNSGAVESSLMLLKWGCQHLFEMASCYLPIPCNRYLLESTCYLVRAAGLTTELGRGLLLTYHSLSLCELDNSGLSHRPVIRWKLGLSQLTAVILVILKFVKGFVKVLVVKELVSKQN